MVVEIQFIEGLKETTLPIIKLTKSRNGKTGTATFIFLKPTIFEKKIIPLYPMPAVVGLRKNKL